ncbi:MAG: putative addiction module antidote protein [Gammaproteobacteria bacterium]|nr:putative addiction module antidote protein [Gammaproteobacteria bacterium]MXW45246.1 putative addiction module antidote protein [Gammaproteobacteria bacterium]MYD01162.1 putative addiction module antidote protein [Gammaproteobacteria bacterium]MYI24910.1 putative addiction module antidote protein [Gammaproteobacteria bacterium]
MTKKNKGVEDAAGISEWDPADYLDEPEDMIAYLEAAFEDGDARVIAAALGDVARRKGMTQVAAEAGLGRESLYKALSTNGNPSFATILRVVQALGMRLHPARQALSQPSLRSS